MNIIENSEQELNEANCSLKLNKNFSIDNIPLYVGYYYFYPFYHRMTMFRI